MKSKSHVEDSAKMQAVKSWIANLTCLRFQQVKSGSPGQSTRNVHAKAVRPGNIRIGMFSGEEVKKMESEGWKITLNPN